MRGAFVVRLGPETKPAERQFEGWVEEVDCCTELRFRSTEERLKFLGQRFLLAMDLIDQGPDGCINDHGPIRKKDSGTER